MVRPRELNPRPPALQSNALPTELILPRLSDLLLAKATNAFLQSNITHVRKEQVIRSVSEGVYSLGLFAFFLAASSSFLSASAES